MRWFTRPYSLWAVGVVILASLVIAFPTSAAQGGSLGSYTLDAANCTVTISAQVQDEGFYAINIWDDGAFRTGSGGFVSAGSTLSVTLTIGGLILQGASGIGVYLENAVGLAATTTYDSDGSAQLWSDPVATDCVSRGFTWGSVFASGANCTYPLQAGSSVYSVPAGALAFYAPDVNAYTGFNLSPGTWYITEFTDDFAKVWIACSAQPVWIPIENVIR